MTKIIVSAERLYYYYGCKYGMLDLLHLIAYVLFAVVISIIVFIIVAKEDHHPQ